MLLTVQLLLAVTSASAVAPGADDSDGARVVPVGRWVTVPSPLGKASKPIRLYLTDLELSVIAGIQRLVNGLELSPEIPLKDQDVTWYVEPVAQRSPTFRLQRDVLYAMNRAIDGRMRIAETWPFSIVIGRTQKFIHDTLAKLNCRPNLDRFGGAILMGAAVCNRRVVVSNITGYLFLLRADQTLTPDLEVRREKPISDIPYRVVSRASSALAHEFVHIWRAAGLSGQVRYDEPAWFAEGFAEFWAGIGQVLAYPRRLNYLTQHAVRVRDFNDWTQQCTEPLSAYRTTSATVNGCEYHAGLAAVEYLFARYASVATTLDAFARASEYPTFAEGFRGTFGITLEEFEEEATRYIENIRLAERLG